jgi:hypothetical protein
VRNKFSLLSHQASILTLTYSSKINSYLYHQRVYLPLKKRRDMFSEGNAAHPVGCDSPLQIVMKVGAFLKKLLNFGCDSLLLTIMAVWRE